MFLRRLLTYIFIFFACLVSYGQVNQVLWGKGKALYANPIATIDSLTYGQLLYGDTLYIIFDRESKRIVYDTIHVHMPGIVFHDTIYTTDTIFLESGRRIGVFSVAADKQVTFSQGNLQYTQSTDTWQFANEQWECIGAGNIKEGALADKIDLFGWSANNTTAPWGISLSTNNSDYAGEFLDWGENIINSDVPNTWRTLTNAEWEYVLNGRDNASQLRCRAQVDHVNGFVFLPDDWVCPDGIELNLEQPTTKVFTRDEWRKMENAGAVFLPSAGRIDNKQLVNFDDHGNYWSSTRIDNTNVDYFAFTFSTNKLHVDHQSPLHFARSVRLVHDTIVPEPPKRIGVFSVSADKQVSFSQGNLQYTQSTDEWRFAREQYEYIGAANIKDGALADKIDLFGWSANNTTAPFGVSTSTNVADYAGTFVDWGTNEICGDKPNTWRTLSADEWKYLFEQRKNALQLRSKGSIDGHRGHILLPDYWVLPEGVQFVAEPNNLTMDLDINSYTQAEWRIMEEAGAIFLPAAGRRDGTTVGYLVEYSGVWSSTSTTNTNAFHTYYNYESQIIAHHWTSGTSRINGRTVRLVHDTIVPETIPDPCFVVKVNDTLSINMMCVEGGTFMMGAMEGDTQANANEKPAHEVTLTYDYYIGQTEVTQALWKAVMGYNPSTIIGDNLPVNNVLWGEAQAFVYKLNQITGLSFDLPTEAEWEYAARGGKKSKGYLYAGSNKVDEVAWYGSNSGNKTHEVATKKPNELGIYDMSGNVIEWCSDWLGPYSAEAQVNPTGPATGAYHVYCGGCWYLPANVCRCTHRRQTTAGYGEAAVGLRVALREKVDPEAIDLGLSVKWANFNIGAFHPTHCGDYFAWGETEPKDEYSWATYKWCDGTDANITKYNTADGKTILEPEDDAAQVNWGGKWRMPTKEEIQELIDNCTWSESIQNGVKGYVVTSKHTGNSIFFPYSGYFNHDNSATLQGEKTLFYTWSVEHSDNTRAYDIHNRTGAILLEQNTRRCGFPIRPVYDDRPPKRIGVFSVSADNQVSFSQGNLQYTQSTDEWRFAREQHEYIGAANIKDGALADRIDLFGWSANNTTAPFGISTSTNAADYAGDFVDWGVNTIQGDAPNTWRTLSADEWEYVFKKRKNASDLYGVAQVAGVNGMIILPDHWEASKGIVFKSGLHSSQVDNYSVYQSFTYDQWLAMENAGAVFLPALGYRDGTNVEKCNTSGYYWSNTTSDEKTAYRLYFYSYFLNPNDVHSIYRGRSVRLVHDTIVPETIPDPCLVVKVNDTLSINMMCVEGGTFTMGDGDNAHPVSLSNYSIGQTEVTQALWEAVMGTNPSANTTNKQLPVTNISWYDCQEFTNRLNQLTGLRFRLPTEAEWEYAARGGQKSKGYTYAGSDDLKEVAWYNGNSGNTLHAVAQKKPNELGIYDMSGNAWEWCHDWHAPYPTTHQYNPLGPEVGQIVGKRYLRVFRGGSYGYAAAYHQNTFRDITGPEPDKGTANLGLRLVLSDEINFQTIHVNDTLSFHMMDVKGGTFTMGDDNISNASPAHQVTLSDYYIGETEVTQALWKAVMGDIPTGNKNPSNPIGYVSYADCQNFIAKLNNLTGLYFQLPTEAEWEYAAMGGNRSHGYLYSGSNTIDDVAWYDQNSGNKMHNVGAKQPNELGIYDMSGNAWEWCADYHSKYTAENQINPQGPATGTDRVLRSGSFRTIADRCTNKHRQARDADYPDSHITLRLVLHDTVPVSPEPEYVDLGLSVKWATFNVGATSPEDYGDYFAWGETEPKETYSWATYKWGTSSKLTKYNTTDGKTILDLDDDAAYVNWGGKWRMPSKEEVDELTQQCNWIWTTHNNVNGYKVTGPNGNSIFLPAAGYKGAGPTYPAGEDGLYWTNTIEKQHYSYLIVLHDDAPPTQVGKQGTRCFGFAVRAVYDDRPPKRIGVFSVAADKQVSFSQGNLQYTQSTDTWRFACEQYEYIGAENIKDGALADKIDLFGWSANSGKAPFGISTSTNAADYAGEFVDWGTNAISGDEPGTWRTLSKEEWEYLLNGRENAEQLRTKGSVEGKEGVILLPDNWICPEGYTIAIIPDEANLQSNVNTYSQADWNKLEAAGAIILPSAGMRRNATELEVGHPNIFGGYWTCTNKDEHNSYCYTFHTQDCEYVDYSNHRYGRSVRLVHDTIVSTPEPEYVDLGLSVKWATFNVGASKPEDYGDYFAWGETEPKETYSWATYKWCDGTDANITKYNTADGKTILEPADDAAQVHWGGKWRMPTKEELQELIDSCQWERVTLNSVIGNKITGPNGNSIFIPAAGSYNSFDNQLHSVGSAGWLYSSSAVSNTFAREINIGYSGAKSTSCSKCLGLTIRPVYDDRPPKRIGVFSVAADKQVSFSQGNLQYTQSTDEWRFAREQYEYIGADNIQNSALADKIDLFGWSSDSGKAPFGISTSQTAADYMGQFVDWGVNEIQGDAANTWRTLSQEEWNYIFANRKNAKLLYSKGSIDGVRGMIVLPDDWVQPQGLHFTADPTNLDMNLDINVYTAEQWQKMEEAGAVFLCPTGRRDGTEIGHTVWYGGYWSSSRSGEHVKHMYFNYNYEIFTTNYSSGDYSYGYNGRAVRLVHDTIVPPPAPCQTFEVNGVTFNMMCVEGEMYDYKIAQTEVTQGLWEQVMGYNNSLFKGEYLPVEKVSWEECQTFIQKLNEITGKHFRLPTEAEWEYAARGGKNSRGSTYAGSNSIDSVAWYQSNSQEQTHTIATLMPNELGIYDMSGNVWEWCQDYYDASTQRVVRGGSFYDVASVCRISSRSGRDANYRSYIGLRLVLDEHEYVDLGLSVKWATTNVGAESAEDYGEYFAWGETEPKEEYSWENYKWCDGDYTKLNKYCTKEQYGIVDNQTILQLCDDAAHTKLGGNWRMPTMEECQELVNLCTWTWTTINGINGHVITGPNGNTIFLPATGAIITSGLAHAGQSGYYWINSISTTSPYNANDIYNRPPDTEMDGSLPTYGINAYSRYIGRPIRPVYDDR